MSVEAMSRVLNGAGDLRPTEKLVLLGIANHAGDGGAWPSLRTLARYSNVSVRQVQKCLRSLEERGYVTTRLQRGGVNSMRHYRRPNLYTLHLDRINPPDDDPF